METTPTFITTPENTDNVRRPQFLRTIVTKQEKAKSQWPESWKQNPDVLRLVHEHQTWLSLPATQKAHSLLLKRIEQLSVEAAKLSMQSTVSSETVRCYNAQVNALIEMEKTTYDTEKYVESITRAE